MHVEVSRAQLLLLIGAIQHVRQLLDEEDSDERSIDDELAERLAYLEGLLENPPFVVKGTSKTTGRPSRDFGVVATPVHRMSPEEIQELGLSLKPELVEVLQITKFENHRHRFVVVSGDGLSAEDTESLRDAVADHFSLPTVATNYPIRVELYEIERRLGRYEAITEEDEPAPPQRSRFQTRAPRNRRAEVHFRRRGSSTRVRSRVTSHNVEEEEQ